MVTYVVCGYNPTTKNKVEYETTYQHHQRFYIDKQKELTYPRKRFVNDLIKQLETWREEGARIVLCADANENIYDKALGKRLTSTLGLNMKELVGVNLLASDLRPFDHYFPPTYDGIVITTHYTG